MRIQFYEGGDSFKWNHGDHLTGKAWNDRAKKVDSVLSEMIGWGYTPGNNIYMQSTGAGSQKQPGGNTGQAGGGTPPPPTNHYNLRGKEKNNNTLLYGKKVGNAAYDIQKYLANSDNWDNVNQQLGKSSLDILEGAGIVPAGNQKLKTVKNLTDWLNSQQNWTDGLWGKKSQAVFDVFKQINHPANTTNTPPQDYQQGAVNGTPYENIRSDNSLLNDVKERRKLYREKAITSLNALSRSSRFDGANGQNTMNAFYNDLASGSNKNLADWFRAAYQDENGNWKIDLFTKDYGKHFGKHDLKTMSNKFQLATNAVRRRNQSIQKDLQDANWRNGALGLRVREDGSWGPVPYDRYSPAARMAALFTPWSTIGVTEVQRHIDAGIAQQQQNNVRRQLAFNPNQAVYLDDTGYMAFGDQNHTGPFVKDRHKFTQRIVFDPNTRRLMYSNLGNDNNWTPLSAINNGDEILNTWQENFKSGGILNYNNMYYNKYQDGGAAPSGDDQQQQIVALVQAAMQGDDDAQQTIQQIQQAANQGDEQASQMLQVIQQIVQQMQGGQEDQSNQTPAARFGAKLNYLRHLKGECPQGTHLEYFKAGGVLCKKCIENNKKQMEIREHAKGGATKGMNIIKAELKKRKKKC